MNEEQLRNFWKKVDVKGPAECWLWTASKARGYGQFCVNGRMEGAHRISASLAGLDIEGLCVCHHCDNPTCVNPAHLFTGTPADNNRDRDSKGRQTKGEAHGPHKLTAAEVLEIRALNASGVSGAELARQFGVAKETIYDIINRVTWKHI